MGETAGLEQASREELQAIIAAQRAEIAALQERVAQLTGQVAELTTRLKGGGGKGFPGLKPQQVEERAARPRKKRARGYARRKREPTERVEHAVEWCPDCGTRLLGGSVKRRREVLEIPLAPVRVIEPAYVERGCPLCRKRWTPRAELAGLVAGQQRLGVHRGCIWSA